MSKTRIGVVNWDGCMDSLSTYFGGHCAASFGPEKHRNRLPFYADVSEDGRVSFHERTKEEFDKELQYAMEAGIDYFAHVWYTRRTDIPRGECASETTKHVHELTKIRDLHVQSPLAHKVKMCAILSAHPLADEELCELAQLMQKSCYETYLGRPLVYIYSGYDKSIIARLKDTCKKEGTPSPYVVIFTNNREAVPEENYDMADGVSAYCIPTEDTDCREQGDFDREMNRLNSLMLGYGLDVIPIFSAGWNPSPRVDTPVPWYKYANKIYASPSDSEDMAASARSLAGWMKEAGLRPRHILCFAWNEFEEGGYICPLRDKNGNTDTSRTLGFRNAMEIIKESLT